MIVLDVVGMVYVVDIGNYVIWCIGCDGMVSILVGDG